MNAVHRLTAGMKSRPRVTVNLAFKRREGKEDFYGQFGIERGRFRTRENENVKSDGSHGQVAFPSAGSSDTHFVMLVDSWIEFLSVQSHRNLHV